MDTIERPDIFLDFDLPLTGATVLIVALEVLCHRQEKSQAKKRRQDTYICRIMVRRVVPFSLSIPPSIAPCIVPAPSLIFM